MKAQIQKFKFTANSLFKKARDINLFRSAKGYPADNFNKKGLDEKPGPKNLFKYTKKLFLQTKRNISKIVVVFLCLIIIFSVLPGSYASAQYTDVPESYWAYPFISYLSDRGFLQGYADNLFSPENSVTNAEFTAIACRMTGMDDTKLEKSSYWAESDIEYALYMKWFTEKEMPSAEYAKPITREFAARIVMKAFFPDTVNSSDKIIEISDEKEIDYINLTYVKLAYSLGILTGYSDGSFRPKQSISRAEASALLYRAWQKYYQDPNGSESITVPILLYHHFSDTDGYTSGEKFRKDMNDLKGAGYTTIFYSELFDYVSKGKDLPKKPVIVSIDDGYYSNYQYAYPVLKELGMKAEISVIGCWVGIKQMPNVIPHFSWAEAMEMYNSDNVHIESHSYRMHDFDPKGHVTRYGVLKKPDENYKQYIYSLSSDTKIITALVEQNMGYTPLAYTYPNGFYTPLSEKILQSLGYKITLTTKVGINTIIKGDPSSLMHLKRIAVDGFNGDVVPLIQRSYF